METNANTTKVTDLGLAATLISIGYPVSGLDKKDSRRVYFCFENVRDPKRIEKLFWNGNLKVDAFTLCQNIKLLKNRLHSGRV